MNTETKAPRIESDDLSLSNLFKDFYVVPDFQREYVWKAEHVEKLLTDIVDEFYDGNSKPSGNSEYFIGSIVACLDADNNYQLIDGQQRLTTIYLTICAIRDRLVQLGYTELVALQGFIKSASIDPRTFTDTPKYRLTLQYEDSHGVLESIANASVSILEIPQKTGSIKHIIGAYSVIQEFIVVNFGDNVEHIKAFLAAFMYRVKLIRILTPNLAHALKVFETINDRGVGLNAMDLLKNLLFIRTNSNEYARLKAQWKELTDTLGKAGEKPLRFLRYFIMAQYDIDPNKPLREDEIYSWFVDNSELCGIKTNPLVFLKQLTACAQAYKNFLEAKDRDGNDVLYIQNISLLAGGAIRQHLILLLAGKNLGPELFKELCRNIENLFFCYLITREQSKSIERVFIRWAQILRNAKTSEELNSFIIGHLHKEIAERASSVNSTLAELSQSKIQQYRMRYILAKMTQFIEKLAFDNSALDALASYIDPKVEIEHILPQTPTPKIREEFSKSGEYNAYVGRLGNLTLLERPINATNQNREFKDKKIGYAASNFLLTQALNKRPVVGSNTSINRAVADLPEFDGWDASSIERRQKALVDLAQRIWMADIPANQQ
ncbi:MAG: DUF262 domain-containing HNH endonuclease family protein [Bacteroidota bacterium]